MKERPILFSTEMVRAILDGRKTQTRRKVSEKIMDRYYEYDDLANSVGKCDGFSRMWEKEYLMLRCPYEVGDVLWVREKWKKNDMPIGWPYHYYAANDTFANPDNEKWNPSIHMPRKACRLRLEITDIRVERLQDITEEDAMAEGVERDPVATESAVMCYKSYISGSYSCFPYVSFRTLWQSINGKESWEANPYVFVIQFKKI